MKKLYCFDFDGTLTKKDTMFLFLRFYNKKRFWFQFLFHIPLFILLKLKLANAENVKRSLIFSVLQNAHRKDIEKMAEIFFNTYYSEIIRENALEFIHNIDSQKTKSFLVTASLDIWVKPFADKWGMTLLSTEVEWYNNRLTKKFATPNCNKEEKVTRIKNAIQNQKFDKTIAFGDTNGDSAMLRWANESHFQYFH